MLQGVGAVPLFVLGVIYLDDASSYGTASVHIGRYLRLAMAGSVAEWLGSRTCDQQVAGSNPCLRASECNPGQVVYPCVPLSPNSIIWYPPVGGDTQRLEEVTLGLVETVTVATASTD